MASRKVFPGAVFGRLTVVCRAPDGASKTGKPFSRAECRCECGNTVVVRNGNLTNGTTKSCGCLHREGLIARSTRHGLRGTRVYAIWSMMLQRCTNPRSKNYKDYGARGITVCEQWHDVEAFAADMGHPAPGMTLERSDNDGPYAPWNCRWATRAEQSTNKRSNVYFEVAGERLPAVVAAQRMGVSTHTLRLWRRKGLTDGEIEHHAARSPRKAGRRLTTDEIAAVRARRLAGASVRELAAEYGVPVSVVYKITGPRYEAK